MAKPLNENPKPETDDLKIVDLNKDEKKEATKKSKWPVIGKYDLNDEATRTKVITWVVTGIIILIAVIWIISTMVKDASNSAIDKEKEEIQSTLLDDPVDETPTQTTKYDPYNQIDNIAYEPDDPQQYDPNSAFYNVKENKLIVRDISGTKNLIDLYIPVNYQVLSTKTAIMLKPANYNIAVDGNDPVSVETSTSTLTDEGIDLSTVEVGQTYNLQALNAYYLNEYLYYDYTVLATYPVTMCDGATSTVYITEVNRMNKNEDIADCEDSRWYEIIIPVPNETYQVITTISQYAMSQLLGGRYPTIVDLSKEIFVWNESSPILIDQTMNLSTTDSHSNREDIDIPMDDLDEIENIDEDVSESNESDEEDMDDLENVE